MYIFHCLRSLYSEKQLEYASNQVRATTGGTRLTVVESNETGV